MVHLATTKTQHNKMAGLQSLAVVLLVFGLFLPHLTEAQLHVLPSKPCGDTQCDPHNFCRDADQICSNCSFICDPKLHNFQEKICENQCQDYLHDLRYQMKGGTSGATDDRTDLYAQIQRLQVIATVALIISLVFAGFVLSIAAIWIKKKNLLPFLFKKKKSSSVHDKSRYVGDVPISTIRLPGETTVNLGPINDAVARNAGQTPPSSYTNMTTFKTPAPKKAVAPETPSPTTTTTTIKSINGITRVPSEDSSYAYDNPALTPSPKAIKANISK